ncbi:MAG: efflux RND transporter periplasmic adaptor subunit [Saccharospirillaceae bacterium]|nr:efflux RND transporter periplasmic adaptor subunit [Pseudomonadales bacterium]NRB79712.1 efflux RND transporter periplasmic adaptor subunit [Saccharospirillaceae bacterium]
MKIIKNIFISLFLIGIGFILSFVLINNTSLLNSHSEIKVSSEQDEKQPLYWVAPMDPNFRKDEPGLSPMGMELVPFFADENSAEIGSVRIHPDVAYNLGLRTQKVIKQPFVNTIKTVGIVAVNQNNITHVHSRVTGWIEKLYVKTLGEEVKKGQALYEIYSPELVNAQEELLIALKRNNKFLVSASSERLLALQVSKTHINELKKTKKVKQTVVIYAKASGYVTKLNISEGFYIKPDITLMALTDLSNVWIKTQVFESSANKIHLNMNVHIDVNNHIFNGIVDYIYPILDKKNRSLTVRTQLDNPELILKPNMQVNVVLSNNDTKSTLQIPIEALIRLGYENKVVIKIAENQFKSVNVKVGRINENWAEVISGLEVNDEVVTSAQFMIDSESSKTSDFKRYSDSAESNMQMKDKQEETENGVWVTAIINSVNIQDNQVNVDHPPIKQWNWPAMTMNFVINESVDTNRLIVGSSLEIHIIKDNKKYVIDQVKSKSKTKTKNQDQVTVKATLNSINAAKQLGNFDHPPIKLWNWPAMTMNFNFDDSIDLDTLKINSEFLITIEKQNKKYVIVNTMPSNHSEPEMDHSNMKH